MQYTAIISDLFGTLVGEFSRQRYEDISVQMAREVHIPHALFHQALGQTFHNCILGRYAWIEQNIAQVCAQLGAYPSGAALQAAAAHRQVKKLVHRSYLPTVAFQLLLFLNVHA